MPDLTLQDYKNQGYKVIEPELRTLDDYKAAGYKVVDPQPTLNRAKLSESITNADTRNDLNNRTLIDVFLAEYNNENPFDKSKYDSRVRSYLGLKAGAELPASSEILKTIQNSIMPPDSSPEWQSYKKYLEVEAQIIAGEDTEPIEEEVGPLTAIGDIFFPLAPALRPKIDPLVHHFQNSRIAQLVLGRKILSRDMQHFALKSMLTKNFNFGIFNGINKATGKPNFNEKEKQYFFNYLSAINPEQDLDFLEDVGARLKNAGYDIGQSFLSTSRLVGESLVGVHDPKILYLTTKGLKDKDKIRSAILANVRMTQARTKTPIGTLPLHGRPKPASAEELTDNIMDNYDQLFEQGEKIVQDRKDARAFRNSIRIKIKEEGGIEGMALSSVSMGLDLAGAIALGIPTGGVGAAAWTFGRYVGDVRESLMYDHGVNPSTATNIALVSSVPYVTAEMLGLKALTGLGKSFTKGWKAFSVDYVKTYGAEVSQETVQSFIEAGAKAYAKEFADAEGISYAELEKDIGLEFREALKGMALISLLGPTQRSIRNRFNVIDVQSAMGDKAEIEGEAGLGDLEVKFDDANEISMIQDLQFADTVEEKREILKENDSDLTVKEANALVKDLRTTREATFREAESLRTQEQKELAQIDQLTERQLVPEKLTQAFGDYAEIEVVAEGQFKLTGTGGLEANINLIPEAEFQSQYGADKLGAYDPGTKTIVLPETATDFKFIHESVHLMRDTGLITDSQLNQVVKDARKIATPEQLAEIEGLDKEAQDQELAANLIEEINRTGKVPEGLDTIWQKMKAWIRDMSAKLATFIEKSGRSIAKDIIAGKPFAEKIGETQTDAKVRFSKEQQANKERLAVINLAKALYRGQPIPIGTDPDIAQKAQDIVTDTKADIQYVKDDAIINKAIRKAEVRQYFREKIDQTFEIGLETGIEIQKAKGKIEKKIKKAKAKVPKSISDIAAKIVANPEIDIENAVIEVLTKEGIIKKGQSYKSTPEYIESVRQVALDVSRAMMKDVVPGNNKNNLWKRIKSLQELKSAAGLITNAKSLINDINKAKIKQTEKQLSTKFNSILNQALKRIVKGQVIKAKEGQIDPLTGRFLRMVKEVAKLSDASVNSKILDIQQILNNADDFTTEQIQDKLASWADAIPSLKKKFLSLEQVEKGITEDLNTKLIILQKALLQYGSMKNKSLTEKYMAIDSLNDVIDGSIKRLVARRAIIKDKADQSASKIIKGVKGRGQVAGTVQKALAAFTGPVYGIKSLFNVSLKNSKGETKKAAQSAYNELFSELSRAENEKDVAVMDMMTKFHNSIANIYGIDVKNVFKKLSQLTKFNPKYDKYSKQNHKLNKLHLMQFIGAMEQEAYKDNPKIQSRDYEGMKAELNEADLQLLEWFKEFYAENRQELSAKVNDILGVPIQQDDINYVPVKIKTEKSGLGTMFSGTTIVPAALTPRVDHKNDLDETQTIMDMFLSRGEQNQFFLKGANVMQQLEMIFGSIEMQNSIEKSLGKSGKKYFYAAVQDWINNGYQFDTKMASIDYMRNFFTINKFMYNPRIGIKQLTSIPAFALEISMMNTVEYLSTAFTTDGRSAMLEILNHPLAEERMNVGPLEEIRHLMGSTPNQVRAFMKHALIFNKWGDIIPTMLIGQGMLRANYDLYKQNMSDVDAKEKAMFDVFELAQRTQQSGKKKEQAYWQRRGGSAGRALSIFTNTTRQFLEFELVAWQNVVADPSKENLKQMGKVMMINHVLLPAAYQGMNILINMVLGDEPDEQDAITMLAAMISGPFSGYIIFGSMATGLIDTLVKGKKGRNRGFSPMTGILDDIGTIGEIITAEDMDEATDKFIDLMKSLMPPVREFEKARKNYSE